MGATGQRLAPGRGARGNAKSKGGSVLKAVILLLAVALSMAMAEPQRVIAVCGATGKQGGSVVDALLARGGGRFAVRGVSRRCDSPKARALAARGVELACADFDDPASLRRAFDGAHGACCVMDVAACLRLC